MGHKPGTSSAATPKGKPSQQSTGGLMGRFTVKGTIVFGGQLNPVPWRAELSARGAEIIEEGPGYVHYGITPQALAQPLA